MDPVSLQNQLITIGYGIVEYIGLEANHYFRVVSGSIADGLTSPAPLTIPNALTSAVEETPDSGGASGSGPGNETPPAAPAQDRIRAVDPAPACVPDGDAGAGMEPQAAAPETVGPASAPGPFWTAAFPPNHQLVLQKRSTGLCGAPPPSAACLVSLVTGSTSPERSRRPTSPHLQGSQAF